MGEKKRINCQTFLNDVSDYIDGDLPDDLRTSLEAHIARCPDCWVLLDETRKTVEIVRNSGCHPLPRRAHDRLLDALKEGWRTEPPRK